MTSPTTPDWNAITAHTLRDDEALAALYRDVCLRRQWPNTDQGVIVFWAWAEAVHSRVLTAQWPSKFFAIVQCRYKWIADRMHPHLRSRAARRMPGPQRDALIRPIAEKITEAAAEKTKEAYAAKQAADPNNDLTIEWDEVVEALRTREAAASRNRSLATRSPPDINRIHARDLTDNRRLAELFVLLVQNGELAATHDQALRCVMAAEIALERDKRGTPGALFRHTLRKSAPERNFTGAMEQRALRRMGSDERHDMVSAALNAEPRERPAAAQVPPREADIEEVNATLLGPANLGFTHSVLMQCFLPHRSLPRGTMEYQSPHNGRVWLAIGAGMALGKNGLPERMQVPYGAYARILLPHFGRIVDREGSPMVVLGRRRAFMEELEITYGGHSAQLLSQQLLNLLVAQYTLGTFDADTNVESGEIRPLVFVERANLRRAIRRGAPSGAFWVPEFRLSQSIFEAYQRHRAPVRIDHLCQLMRRPRAMDIYVFLCYRSRTARKGDLISIRVLGDIFAPGLPLFKWRSILRDQLKAILEVWPGFDVRLVGNDMLHLAQGKPPVRRIK